MLFRSNPLRVLDCKNPVCQKAVFGAPAIDEHLCDACNQHYTSLQLLLDQLHLPYRKNSMLVRGLDYYQRTVFEVISSDLGSQSALLGGGRYDELVELMGGPPTPAIGFAMGLERLIMLLQQLPPSPRIRSLSPSCFIAHEGKDTISHAMVLASDLRQNGIATDLDLEGKGIKKGLELAIKKEAKAVLIIGKDEIEQNLITLKNLKDRSQVQYSSDQLILALKELLEANK